MTYLELIEALTYKYPTSKYTVYGMEDTENPYELLQWREKDIEKPTLEKLVEAYEEFIKEYTPKDKE